MKKIKLVVAITALSPAIAALLLLALALWLVISLVAKAVKEIRWLAAEATTNSRHRRLLRLLHKVGAPPHDLFQDPFGDDDWLEYPNHDHANCTPQDCPLKQVEVYNDLAVKCEQEHISDWRVRWAA